MKALNLFVAICMALSCVTFVSCGGDDDEPDVNGTDVNGGGVVTGTKKLVGINVTYDDGDCWSYSFGYDSKGRIATITEKDDWGAEVSSYSWSGDVIMEQEENDVITYSLTDNLLRTGKTNDGYNYVFAYNSSKQLTTFQCWYSDYSGDDEALILSWDGDKLVKVEDDYSSLVFSYSGKTCKGYFPLVIDLIEDFSTLPYAHPELAGIRTNQLPSKAVHTWSDYEDDYETVDFSYSFDDDGYLESCTLREEGVEYGSEYSYTGIYTFKWE